jgi:hypothetical protein
MKKLRNLIALMAVFSMAAVFTGCGDDDDDDDNNNVPAGPQFAPGTVAAFIGNTYTVNLDGGQTAQVTFPSATTYSFTSGGVTETGNITGLVRNGEEYTATLLPTDNNGRVRQGLMQVRFTQKTATTFAGEFTVQEDGGPRTYPFTATVNTGGTNGGTNGGTDGTTNGGTDGTTNGGTDGTTNGGTDGTTNGGTDGTTNGGTDGTTNGGTTGTATEPPASLVGKTLQLTYPATGGGERFDFTSETSAIYEQGTDTLTYTWDLGNTRIQGTLRNAGGDTVGTFDITLAFNAGSGNAGNATVIFTDQSGTPVTDPATFTLLP